MSQPLPNKNLPMPSLRNIQAFIESPLPAALIWPQRISMYYRLGGQPSDSLAWDAFLGKKLFSRSSKGVAR